MSNSAYLPQHAPSYNRAGPTNSGLNHEPVPHHLQQRLYILETRLSELERRLPSSPVQQPRNNFFNPYSMFKGLDADKEVASMLDELFGLLSAGPKIVTVKELVGFMESKGKLIKPDACLAALQRIADDKGLKFYHYLDNNETAVALYQHEVDKKLLTAFNNLIGERIHSFKESDVIGALVSASNYDFALVSMYFENWKKTGIIVLYEQQSHAQLGTGTIKTVNYTAINSTLQT